MQVLSKALRAATSDEAAQLIQAALQITDGTIAGQVFGDAWEISDLEERRALLHQYLVAELAYA